MGGTLIAQDTNGLEAVKNTADFAGVTASLGPISVANENQWKGKNGKWYNNIWGGNQHSGGRTDVLKRADTIKAAGQGLFFVSAAISTIQLVDSYQNGDNFGVAKAALDMGWGAAATFGGTVGAAGYVSYSISSALIDNYPAVRSVTVTPVVNALCYMSGNC